MPNLFRRHGSALSVAWLIVGLGNPGAAYAANRHNAGFWTVNRLARAHGIDVKAKGKLAATGEGDVEGVRVALAKPRTFVNRSGDAVRELLRRHGLAPDRLLVVYDELDLPSGQVRIRPKGSHGGHNGMRSIVEAVGQNFARIRIGIGRPTVDGEPTRDPDAVAEYVLSDPSREERARLDDAVATAIAAIETLLREGLEAAMSRFNREPPTDV